ncbi:MAG: HAMP domain-containing histidine kinase [Schaedlerella sp.]|uniref:sensor histidine kinase n=1 Tax=Schaedlerella sp. TaxID=2676057 RepID=UPI002614F2AE|nr:HAMP domain-containing sensor histidine kinase [uncultured Schaedlerella sp.]
MEIIIQFIILGMTAFFVIFTGGSRTAFFGLLCCTALCFISARAWYRREKQLEELILYLMKLQDHPEIPELPKYSEGQIGVLQSEIYKLVIQNREQSAGAVREKEYLAQMLSDISHQIKTPLTSITIMTDLLKSPNLDEEKRVEFTDKIDSQVSRITWLIRNLLTLSQLDANMLKLKKQDVPVRELIQKACQPFEILAELKEVELSVSADGNIRLICDAHWTAEAISNIVKNCIEHTQPGGEVCVTVSQNNLATDIFIRDNGEGIAKEHLPYIFDRFYKAGNQSNDSVGIGLAMSRQMIMLQNGTISVSSEEEAGTEFHIKMYSEVVI